MSLRPFPPAPVRGMTQRGRQLGNCFPNFVLVTVDLLPGEPGFALEVAPDADCHWCWPGDRDALLTALAKGIEEELRRGLDGAGGVDGADGLGGEWVLAARVVITYLRTHEVDSAPPGFERNGRLLARRMLGAAGSP